MARSATLAPARIAIVTPAKPGARTGNLHTAQRWAGMLRAAGYRVSVATEWTGERCDLLVALHARRSHPSVVRYRREHPAGALAVTLTGTDLYRDLPRSREARESLARADRIVVLQSEARALLSEPLQKKTNVVHQSSSARLRHRPPRRGFRIAVIGHLREEKDPFRAAMALARLPGRQELEVVQIGGALSPEFARKANQLMRGEPRYRWLGSLPHARALGWLARSHLLVVSSVMEGGANVISEAARIGTPVLASRVSGNVGMLGKGYPGYFPLFDDQALARLIRKAGERKSFYRGLMRALSARRGLFAPPSERAALLGVVGEALAAASTPSQSSVRR